MAGRHRSATTKIYGDKTSKGSKVLNGYCSICKRNKSMTASDNTIKVKGLCDFFSKIYVKRTDCIKKDGKKIIK